MNEKAETDYLEQILSDIDYVGTGLKLISGNLDQDGEDLRRVKKSLDFYTKEIIDFKRILEEVKIQLKQHGENNNDICNDSMDHNNG